jgi:hypothetical protein
MIQGLSQAAASTRPALTFWSSTPFRIRSLHPLGYFDCPASKNTRIIGAQEGQRREAETRMTTGGEIWDGWPVSQWPFLPLPRIASLADVSIRASLTGWRIVSARVLPVWHVRRIRTDASGPTHPWSKFVAGLRPFGQREHPRASALGHPRPSRKRPQ